MNNKRMEIQKLQQKAMSQAVRQENLENLLGLGVNNPLELDSLTQALGFPAFLINPYLATKVSLFGKEALHIPVQISPSERGRPSLYYLEKERPTLVEYFIFSEGLEVWQRIVTRKTGQGKAKTGDLYEVKLLKLDGTLMAHWTAQLRVIDAERGYGELIPIQVLVGSLQPEDTEVWVLWSMIYVIKK